MSGDLDRSEVRGSLSGECTENRSRSHHRPRREQAGRAVEALEKAGVLVETTGKERDRYGV